jgi:hypothetical protein
LLQAFDHGRGDAAEGQDCFFHWAWARRDWIAKQANILSGAGEGARVAACPVEWFSVF